MTTVVSRVIRSLPHRNTSATWTFIVDLLTRGKDTETKKELMAVAGTMSAVIAEQGPKEAAIVVSCDGPRTRIYCLYDEEAIEGDEAKEESLSYDPLKGHWSISIPCPRDDLEWVQRSLKSGSGRVTARDMSQTLGEEGASAAKSQAGLKLNLERFLGQ